MKIVFSRKGFDSSYGGAPSPIIDGRPVSLPIPGSRGERTTYDALGYGDMVTRATRGRIRGDAPCHDDPMFADGHWWLGQVNAAQSHLRNQNVGVDDVFLFFGLFADERGGDRHHRIFGAMRVACYGAPDAVCHHEKWREPVRPHPHFSGQWEPSNTIYHGPGLRARSATSALRLTSREGPASLWRVPAWMTRTGMSYHRSPARWLPENKLRAAARGQEFVCDVGDDEKPRRWLNQILEQLSAD